VSLASLSNIEKTFGRRIIFGQLSLTIYAGERIGLIGPNGSGKTTLLRILTGKLLPDTGQVSIARNASVGYLTQDPVFDPENTVIDEAELAFAELHRLSHRLRELEHEMEDLRGDELEKVLKRYQSVQHDFDLAGGYAWRHKLEATLQGIGLGPATWEQNVQTLSGGQRSRLALAKLLISEPDLLLLDEPTNHLDLSAIEWLERYLLDFKGAVLLISHDRYLLDRLATRIAWLRQHRLFSYPGNYSAFIKQREVEELSQQRAFEQQQADIEKQKEFIRRFGAGQRSKEAKGREKRLNRLLQSDSLIGRVDQQKTIRVSMSTDRRAGDQVLSVQGLSKEYDGNVLWREVNLFAGRGDRLGIIGPNGSGKTTLLESLLGLREADEGHVKWGANLKIGYYDQRLDDFDPELTVMEEVSQGRDLKEQALRDALAVMLFRGEEIHKPMGLLSGGERARVALVELLLDRPNVLVLDEPTNHLDIESREALEQALAGFDGTILCVSHDRYFLDRIIRRLVVLQPPEVKQFDGNYSQWIEKVREMEAERATRAVREKSAAPSRAPGRKAAVKKDNPYLRPFGRLSVEELEEQIHRTEAELAECQSQFGDSDTFRDATRAQKLQAEYEALQEKLEQLEMEYFTRE
jgi:ATP-binding cassette, subfamily F, member 3